MVKPAIPRLALAFVQGKTFKRVIRWEKEPLVSKAITGITKGTPARVTAVAHGLTDGWRAAPVGVSGMRQINADNFPPKDRDFHRCTVVDVDHVTLDDVSSADFSAYTTGGSLVFYTPASLDGCTARMTIRTGVGGTELLSLTTENDRIVLDDAAKTITLLVAADDTAALTWQSGFYDLEIEDSDGFVTGLYQGTVNVTREETT